MFPIFTFHQENIYSLDNSFLTENIFILQRYRDIYRTRMMRITLILADLFLKYFFNSCNS